MNKWGYIMQTMIRDIRNYNIAHAYAYNSDFDDKVFSFNCDWFKCENPFDNIVIHDIWGYASQFITNNEDYKIFCEKNSLFTESGNYKGSAESVYQYLTKDENFIEKHMGLMDVIIETNILINCIERGANWHEDYKVNKILPRINQTPFSIKINGEEIFNGIYFKKYIRNNTYNFVTIESVS